MSYVSTGASYFYSSVSNMIAYIYPTNSKSTNHIDFICVHCGKDTDGEIICDGKYYHARCYTSLFRINNDDKCTNCDKIISKSRIMIDSKLYCMKCFNRAEAKRDLIREFNVAGNSHSISSNLIEETPIEFIDDIYQMIKNPANSHKII